ncbi:ferredoxin [Acrocarpospora macrocephala]|uniref:Ferredoxin n=1 Tax=Acrocarpospora macrocephala TaxID=150177 RepID=A0A5M3WGB9_9ACTN|nr:ferredoxin [Acrocarpospora macrocephala]GES07162.1 ferredoxin [Acrocarpospora macrocephala]
MTKIETFQERCIGAGNCVEVAAKYFDLDEDGLVVARLDEVAAGDEEQAERAADICPAVAIVLHQTAG